jgi:hypothetical protein
MTTETAIEPLVDQTTLALLRNDLRGLTRDDIARLVATLTERMGIDPALAPIDLITDRKSGKISPYINARGAAELAKRHDLSDEDLDIDIRDKVVIAKVTKVDPNGRTLKDVGATAFDPDRPDSMARAIKAATTSAHRRATLRMVGIFLSEPAEGLLTDADA